MLSLLFGGALRLGGGFAVLGLALIALIALLSGGGSATARVGVGVEIVLAVSVRFRRGGRRVETNSGCTSTSGL